jgi:ribonuclease HI
VTGAGHSLVLRFDGSVRYGPNDAEPRTAAIGYVIEAADPLIEGSRELSAFVSSTHVEFRALVAGAQAVAELTDHRQVSAVHVRGDAAAVIDTVDPSRPAGVDDAICRRRAERVHEALAPVPTITYRHVGRYENERPHELAARVYDRSEPNRGSWRSGPTE